MKKRAAIIGHPVGHSISPAFQSAAFEAANIDAVYERWETESARLAERVEALRAPAFLGANVTIPHKVEAATLVDELDPQAANVGAINTIVNRSGTLAGYNTDGPGFVTALRNESRVDPRGRSFLLLGSGGAARGIAFALVDAGAAAVSIANRTAERAAALASEVRDRTGVKSVNDVPFGDPPSGFDCIVNCTSLGMLGGDGEGASPCDAGAADPGTLVVDIVYVPAVTPFLRAAEAAGLATLQGLPMLIHQGALAFELWTGVGAPLQVMEDAARRALADRLAADRDEGDRS